MPPCGAGTEAASCTVNGGHQKRPLRIFWVNSAGYLENKVIVFGGRQRFCRVNSVKKKVKTRGVGRMKLNLGPQMAHRSDLGQLYPITKNSRECCSSSTWAKSAVNP